MLVSMLCTHGQYGEPAEIAAVIAFLSSSEASFMTGAIVQWMARCFRVRFWNENT